jgi:hypothetical protein
MAIVVKVLKKVEASDPAIGDVLTLGVPDENGVTFDLQAGSDDDLDALKKGQQYTLAFVPFVPPDSGAAVPTGEAGDATPDKAA